MLLVGADTIRDGSCEKVVELGGAAPPFALAVADGIGGHHAGEVASERVLGELIALVAGLQPGLSVQSIGRLVERWVADVHASLVADGRDNPERAGMGSTLVALLVYEGRFYVLNVGDSRLYRFRGGNLAQLTRDHSLREMTGNTTAADNVIINSLGGGGRVFVDFGPAGGKVLDGDVFMLCSDGLSGMVKDDQLEELLSSSVTAGELVDSAKRAGGEDNISVVLARVRTSDAQPPGPAGA